MCYSCRLGNMNMYVGDTEISAVVKPLKSNDDCMHYTNLLMRIYL